MNLYHFYKRSLFGLFMSFFRSGLCKVLNASTNFWYEELITEWSLLLDSALPQLRYCWLSWRPFWILKMLNKIAFRSLISESVEIMCLFMFLNQIDTKLWTLHIYAGLKHLVIYRIESGGDSTCSHAGGLDGLIKTHRPMKESFADSFQPLCKHLLLINLLEFFWRLSFSCMLQIYLMWIARNNVHGIQNPEM